MFRNWGFLVGEIWVLLLLATLVGLLAGWIIWGRRAPVTVTVDDGAADRLRHSLAACEAHGRDQASRIAALTADLEAARQATIRAEASAMAAPAAMADPGPAEAKRPEALSAPRNGAADDLKLIKGVGPKLEALLHRLGFYHFDQIANWTAAEIAWVDENLEGFRGRVTRDQWVIQARDLAAGLPPRPGGEG
ncbi:hypothetical protein GCM10007291_17340 [Gemmobacter nanjingensis]|uniref:NADH-quinone oxidoreductase subunit E n=1 Tax=Gemmobacter nanjingensis TaxID=488454 RepID=A0ABQ3FDA3_9RHOB|nr:hypothetical protein [Gemmobacter nanjingensis]GHC19080.1 hypothetical protein GCM10007291_17340 [Gemmobacter nanjingensis]